jgi:hypothetical protein
MALSSSGLDLQQRLFLALLLTMDDQEAQLKRLADQGRAADRQALVEELGDWLELDQGEVAPMLIAQLGALPSH